MPSPGPLSPRSSDAGTQKVANPGAPWLPTYQVEPPESETGGEDPGAAVATSTVDLLDGELETARCP